MRGSCCATNYYLNLERWNHPTSHRLPFTGRDCESVAKSWYMFSFGTPLELTGNKTASMYTRESLFLFFLLLSRRPSNKISGWKELHFIFWLQVPRIVTCHLPASFPPLLVSLINKLFQCSTKLKIYHKAQQTEWENKVFTHLLLHNCNVFFV